MQSNVARLGEKESPVFGHENVKIYLKYAIDNYYNMV